jgi:hypothetical protein
MKFQNFQCSVIVRCPVGEAYNAVKSRISEWWGKEVKGSSESLNDIFTVHFGKTSGTCRISELIQNKRITWDVIDCYLDIFRDKTQWNGTSIVWEFSAIENGTQINMTHVGLTPEKECYVDCEGGWTFFVAQSLYNLLTIGKGNPGTGIRARISSSQRTYEGTLYAKEDLVPDMPPGAVIIDVKQRSGEQVLSAHSVNILNNKTFNPEVFKGDYYMVIENKPVFGNISPLQDLMETILQ